MSGQCQTCHDIRDGIRAVESELTAAFAYDAQSRIRRALENRRLLQVGLAKHIAARHVK